VSNEELIRQDETARRRIVQDLDTTFLVEAGAGSGKTTSLVERMLALIASGKAEVSNIAAITFTKKAAAELRERFRMKLEQSLHVTQDAADRAQFERALEHISECYIGTIHSFCGRLLRERPIEAKLDPQFKEIEEEELNELLHGYWDDYLLELREQGKEEEFDKLSENGVNVEDLRAVFLRVSMFEDVEIDNQEIPRPNFDQIRVTLFPLIDEAVSLLPLDRPSDGWDGMQRTIRSARSALRGWNMIKDMNVLTLAMMFDKSLQLTQKRWTDGKRAKEVRNCLSKWRIDVLQPFLTEWKEYLHPHLVNFVLPAVEYSRKRRMDEGTLSFQDLLMRSTELLREHPEVRKDFAKRYSRLFVDEFQDTDPVQAEMMLLLAGSITHENDWRRQIPKPGSLFIVGDPKQSIYRFRRADISTYNFVKRIVSLHGDVLQLTRNFRSVRSIGEFVNYAFQSKSLPKNSTDDHQAAFVNMLTNRDNPKRKGGLHGVFTMNCPKMEWDRKADIALYDAERTARMIAWACAGNLLIADREDDTDVERPARPDDFMILLKYREFIGLYAEMLEQYGIPADTAGSQVLYDELRVLHRLAVCLDDPMDRISLLSVLRGMLFGISDEALYLYSREVGSISLYIPDKDRNELSEQARTVYDALVRLRGWKDLVRWEPALAAFASIVEDIGIIPFSAVQTNGSIRSGTIMKLIEIIGDEPDAAISWHALTGLLGNIIESNGMEGASLFTGTGQAVRIMNLHKAKGLEAPVVFLANPCRDHDPDASEHIDRTSNPACGYFTISRKKDAYNSEVVAQPEGWTELAERERIYMQAEQDRLLYVAATRAKQLLIVSRYETRPEIDPWSGFGAVLDMQPELDDYRVEPTPPERYTNLFDIEGTLRIWNEFKARASIPSYKVHSVTAKVKSGKETEALPRPLEGRGATFGTVLHRCLEAVGNGLRQERMEAYVQMAAAEEGLAEKWIDDAFLLLGQVLSSTIWKRALASSRRFHEFTFTSTDTMDGQDHVLNGVIDLVFEEPDGWVIVDFKTDAFERKDKESFVQFYAPQVNAYAEQWQKLGNGRVKETGLLFLHCNQYVVTGPGT
jgi:ATP-dependent helicase/nuclease subunit A